MNFEKLIDNENCLKQDVLNKILNKIESIDSNYQYFHETDIDKSVIIADWNNKKLDKIENFISNLELYGLCNICADWSDNWMICDQCGKGVRFDCSYIHGNIRGIIGDGFCLCNECLLEDLNSAIDHYTSYQAVNRANYLDNFEIKQALIKEERFVELDSEKFLNIFDENEYNLFLGNYPFDNMNNPYKVWETLMKLNYDIIIYTGIKKNNYEDFSVLIRLTEN